MSEHWTAAELREYQLTGREPVRPRLGLSDGPKENARDINKIAKGVKAASLEFTKKLDNDNDWKAAKKLAEIMDIMKATKDPVPQEEIERRYAEAEARGEVMALDIVEKPDGRVIFQNARRTMVEVTDRVPPIEPRPEYTGCGYLHNQNRNPPPPPMPKSGKKRRKYGNEPTYIGWKKFDSRKEARFYQELMLRKKAGELKCVLRQVAFDLAEKEKLQYIADFVAVLPDNTIEAVYDVKSEATRKSDKYIIKKKLMRELWDIEIKEV